MNHTGYKTQESKASFVAGNAKYSKKFWKDVLHASPYVLGMVRDGYKLPLSSSPNSLTDINNHQSSLLEKDFVEDSIRNLIEKGCIKEVSEPHFCVNPLTVAHSGEKLRLVLDLKYINRYIPTEKF